MASRLVGGPAAVGLARGDGGRRHLCRAAPRRGGEPDRRRLQPVPIFPVLSMTPRRVANVLVVIVFLAVVGGYGAVGLVKTVRERARWAMIRFVPWRLAPTWLEARFAERLPLRLAVAGWHGRAKAEWLHVSPTPRVLLGRQGWLYYNQSAEPGAVPPDDRSFPERLDRWAEALSARRAWLERRGIKYLVVLVPDKRSIYPEFVPRFARRRRPPGLDELLVRCGGDPELAVLDLRPTLR